MSGSFATNSTAREPMKAVLAPRHPQPVRGRKRGKVAHACNRCRIKKFKCDAIRPACLSCHNAGIECSFETDEASEPPEEPEEHMATLQPPGGMDTEDRAIANFLRQNDVSAGVIDPESPSDNSDAEADHAALDAVHRLTWTPFLGIDIHMLRRFAPNSKIDHLDLLETTDIPQSLRSKPVFNPHIFGLNKPTRLHYPKVYDQNVADSTRVWERQQEENFHTRPSVRIVVPDHLKNLLVDDWENVTKSLLVVPLPSKAPVNFIIDTYFDEEKGKRRLGSDEADVLEEFVAGMKVYFDKACGKTLLYKFERPQWAEIRQLWESGKYPEWTGKGPGDAYGAEHLCRMLVNMPEMVAQTNMDVQSVNRLREEISKLCSWLARNSGRFFCAKYEKPTAEYIESAR